MRNRPVLFILAIAVCLAALLGVTAAATAAPFPDLPASVLNGYSLQELEVRGMSQGFTDGTWRPSNSLTRAQFTKMAVENFGIPTANPATPTFTDVPASDIYYQVIEGAVAAGLTNGVGNNTFAPGSTITREQAAAILVRWIAEANDFDTTLMAASDITAALASFTDAASVSPSLRDEMAIAVQLGLVQGSNNLLNPQRAMIRVEGAALLARSSFSLGSVYTTTLDALNASGVAGKALLYLDGTSLRVLVLATGLETGRVHMQHIHGLADGSQAECPTAAADTNSDGIITLAEGLPFYGPVLLPLEPYPTAQAPDGMVFYSHRFTGASLDALDAADVSLTNRVIVLHGKTLNGTYDESLPVACGELSAVSLAYSADLDELNDSGTTGHAMFWLRDQELRALVVAEGAEADKEHMQHIHGLADGSNATCPPDSADTNDDGIISLAEGLPFYGPVLLPLDDPYPVAHGTAGNILYIHKYSGAALTPLNLATAPLTNRVVVMHGLTVGTTYDATVPIACGEVEAITGPAQAVSSYAVHPLVSDLASLAPTVDPNMVNGWGLAAGPTTPWWVANNGTDTSTLYNAAGAPLSLVVDVESAPTGIVYNATTAFPVTSEDVTEPSRFLFSTEEGTILGWNPSVPEAGSTTAFVLADRSDEDAVYKGLAIGAVDDDPYIYATDFVNGTVDVFDGDFEYQTDGFDFVDPDLPDGYAPFGIQTIGTHLFVTYAQQDPDSTDEVAGAGFGYVDEFEMDGDFVARVASAGALDAPWGLAMAPASGFGTHSGELLVGNFGDGKINTYSQAANGTWAPTGALLMTSGDPVVVDGLWGIAFGMGNDSSGPVTTLYFAAGPEDEEHGLFGSITTP